MLLFVAYMIMFKDELNVGQLFQIIELEPSTSTREEEFHILTTRTKYANNHTHIKGQEGFGEIF